MLTLSSLSLCCRAILTLLLMPHECLIAVSSPHNSYVTGGSSLLFFFEARLQSWLMFAQKYVIADFLLINRSRAQAAILPCYYYLCACRLEQGALLHGRGQITLSLQERHWKPLIAAAATKEQATSKFCQCHFLPLDYRIKIVSAWVY